MAIATITRELPEQHYSDGSGWEIRLGEPLHLAAGPLAAARSAIRHELHRNEHMTPSRRSNLLRALEVLESADNCGDFLPWEVVDNS